jgi:hypothetical protein
VESLDLDVLQEIHGLDKGLIEWARRHRPAWSLSTIEAWDDNRLQALMPFVRTHYWSDRHSINVFSVVGTAHPDYAGLTWQRFLLEGKRMASNQALLRENPAYYYDTDVKHPSMLYVSLNGKHWYVNGDGNHRTCLAKFFFARQDARGVGSQTMIHGVTVDDYRVDWRLHDAFLKLREAVRQRRKGEQVDGHRIHIGRDDGPAWKIDRYEPRIRFIDSRGEEQLLDLEGAQAKLAELNKSGLRRWLG